MPETLNVELIQKTGRYKHMARLDVALWERWLDKFAGAYTGVIYDLALGGTDPPGAEADDALRAMWRHNTALRVDACVLGGDHVLLVEVRPYATPSALGSAIAYSLVADRDEVFELPIQPAIVCEGIQPDVAWSCEKLGVLVFKV